MPQTIKLQLVKFFIVGLTAAGIDLSTYFFFLELGFSVNLSKGFGFISGTTFSYFLNSYWTFSVKKRSFKQLISFFTVYSFNICINITVNAWCLYFFQDFTNHYVISFSIATGISAALNFIGIKFFVF